MPKILITPAQNEALEQLKLMYEEDGDRELIMKTARFTHSEHPSTDGEEFDCLKGMPLHVLATYFERPELIAVGDDPDSYWNQLPPNQYANHLLNFLTNFRMYGRADIYGADAPQHATEEQLWHFLMGLHVAGAAIINNMGILPPMSVEQYTEVIASHWKAYHKRNGVIYFDSATGDATSV